MRSQRYCDLYPGSKGPYPLTVREEEAIEAYTYVGLGMLLFVSYLLTRSSSTRKSEEQRDE